MLALVPAAALCGEGCSGGGEPASVGESPAVLAERVAPHVDRLARFDRWAHRVASAAGAWRSRSALEETAFSQVRTDANVVAAWIERPGERALAYPAETTLPATPVRDVQVPNLGRCSVGTGRLDHRGTPVDVLVVTLDHDGLRATLALATP